MTINVLGINFGHDSAVTLVRDGNIVACQLSERVTRGKHFSGLSNALIESFFQSNDLDPAVVDFVAVTSTQSFPIMVEDGDILALEFGRHPEDDRISLCEDKIRHSGKSPHEFMSLNIADVADGPPSKERLHNAVRNINAVQQDPSAKRTWFPMLDYYETVQGTQETGLADLFDTMPEGSGDLLDNRFGFHIPVVATVFGRKVPGAIVHHQATHMATAHYLSGYDDSAIVTLDGGVSAQKGGWLGLGLGNKIIPVNPHFLEVGKLYERVSAHVLKLGLSSAGKMMGLASYGEPRFYDPIFVGNGIDFRDLRERQHPTFKDGHPHMSFVFIRHMSRMIGHLGLDVSSLGDPNHMTDAINADIAASTHKVFAETVRTLFANMRDWVSSEVYDGAPVTAAGGCFLSCPTNSEIQHSLGYEKYFVPPYCDDSGIAIGAALWVTHNLLDVPLPNSSVRRMDPYLGNKISDKQIEDVSKWSHQGLKIERLDVAQQAAQDLAENRVIAWFQGRSELGPRALGHRSILADPRKVENWQRVNEIKHRALWRPFAPAILEDHLETYFSHGPSRSDFMLFNYQVTADTAPAITHVDQSSRAQSVGPSCGAFFDLLTHFYDLTGMPMVMNTSLNGPGEPIVETPEDAVRLFLATDIDVLYVANHRITKSV
ncbi:MAG: hypothetical protein HOL85_05845 [Rhodospirillaceae bacterium]|jgi:carbamoyltransferase|nr:hypothetical protein [Rhodospirillaceae bacterium]MBT6137201.1 hypothetical protein [Rhodospirillaceae bacterium]